MEFFFNPDGVAVIGASNTEGKGGYNIVYNLKNGYPGRIYPVNPQYPEVQGLPCYPSARNLPGKIELAVVFVPATAVPRVIEECADAGVKGVIIQSAGFAEVGPEGLALQARVLATARERRIRLWGPNCIGLVDIAERHVFSFVSPDILAAGVIPGRVSMIVQSGMLSGGFLQDMMTGDGMGFAKVCSIGNKMDVDECDVLAYLLADSRTDVVGCYLETLVDGRRFIELCRRSDKPVVVIKGGKTEHGARAVMSHTAGMAADAAIVSGILAQAGAIEADDFKEMADICNTLALIRQRPAKEYGRVAVLTYSGGAGILSTDLMAGRRLRLAELRPETKKKMEPVFPDWMPVNNPVDFWPAVEKSGAVKTYVTCFKAVLEDPGVDVVFMHLFFGRWMKLDMRPLAELARQAGKPLLSWVIGQYDAGREFKAALREMGVPVFRELDRAMTCMDALFRHHDALMRRAAGRDPVSRGSITAALGYLPAETVGVFDEYEVRRFLAAAGIPTVEETIASTAAAAVDAAASFGYPVAVKGLLPEVVHKTEAGLVRLNLKNASDVREAAAELEQLMRGQGRLLVQKQVAGRLELIAGLVRDSHFGPCVMVGLGGVMAEALNDGAFGQAPLTMADALNMIGRLRSQRLLNGFRDVLPVDRQALAAVLVALGDLGLACDRIAEIDLNPLIISGGKPVVVDAAMIMRPAPAPVFAPSDSLSA